MTGCIGTRGITRREALVGALGVASLPGSLARAAALEWDLIIVGGGTAGLPAAIFAAQQGARVLVLEKSGRLGGTLWFSGGQMSAAGTRLQRSLGIEDSPEAHLADIQRLSRGTADPDIAGLAVIHAAATVDWLLARGLSLMDGHPVTGTGHEPYLLPRVYGPTGRGPGILAVLDAELARVSGQVTVLEYTAAVELVQGRDGTVRGVIGESSGGGRQQFDARRVLLASGGHMADPGLFEALTGVPLYRAPWVKENTGGGLQLGLAAGGFARGGEHFLCDFGSIPAHLDWPANEFARSVHHPQRRPPWEIIVNIKGQRFLREDEPSVDARERALLAQPLQRYWLVFDENVRRNAPTLIHSAPPASGAWDAQQLARAFDSGHPSFRTGATVSDLASNCGMEPGVLAATIADYNTAVRQGDDRLGRNFLPVPLADPPFYAVLHQGSSLISFAGLAVNSKLQVVRQSGEPIGGLYAAGELLGKGVLSGQCFAGGMMVTPALSLGRLVGERALQGLNRGNSRFSAQRQQMASK
ncbi:MAG: FAD-binding protein [Gammaproteobacteria bacterium]|nr:FAD-binding protein [Gammaproteobacteria bacterium]